MCFVHICVLGFFDVPHAPVHLPADIKQDASNEKTWKIFTLKCAVDAGSQQPGRKLFRLGLLLRAGNLPDNKKLNQHQNAADIVEQPQHRQLTFCILLCCHRKTTEQRRNNADQKHNAAAEGEYVVSIVSWCDIPEKVLPQSIIQYRRSYRHSQKYKKQADSEIAEQRDTSVEKVHDSHYQQTGCRNGTAFFQPVAENAAWQQQNQCQQIGDSLDQTNLRIICAQSGCVQTVSEVVDRLGELIENAFYSKEQKHFFTG